MTCLEWFEAHARKHAAIIAKLEGLSDKEIIAYFDYENLKVKEPDFCPLFARNEKCHEMEALNCYLCGCPHFRFADEGLYERDGKTCYSECAIHAKEAKWFESGDVLHLDCSSCTLPHRTSVIEKYFDKEWKKVMAQTLVENRRRSSGPVPQ